MKKFKGVITALITPFQNGEIDFSSLKSLLAFQIKNGVKGFVVNGTTAESPTLTKEEVKKLFQFVKKNAPPQTTIILGTGSNSTKKTIEDSMDAAKWGADAVLVVVPYYNKPPQRGLLEHFRAVAQAVDIPVILYNVPGRTITSLEIDTIKKLSEHPNIIGIKEASGDIAFAKKIRKACGKQFTLLSGDDGTFDEFMEAGGDGVISVSSHIIPQVMIEKKTKAYLPLINALFFEANPMPVKMALSLMGIIGSPECRLPLVTLSPAVTKKLKKTMQEKGLLK